MAYLRNKKVFLYEVDPLFFFDSNNDGYGDFLGFIVKFDYFKFLNIDGIVFPDIFNQEKIIAKPLEEIVFDKYGKIDDLLKIVNKCKENDIDLFITIDLQNISSSALNKSNLEKNQNKKIDILLKTTLEFETEKNWSSQTNINALEKIVAFWNKVGVNNFVLINFENLYGFSYRELNSTLIDQLKKIYEIIKKSDVNNLITLKSHQFDFHTVNNIFKNYINVFCDLYIDNSYSMISTHKNHPFDIKVKFEARELIKKISKLNINPELRYRYIISFGNNLIGRVLSRWMNEESLHLESAKTLLMILHMLPYSSSNYYGDELGMLRCEITNVKQYYDFSFVERKRKLENLKFSEKLFFQSQKMLSKINSQSTFIWNNAINNGFTNSKNIIRPKTLKSEIVNVDKQYNDSNSILNFYRSIINNYKNDIFSQLDQNSKFYINTKKFKNIYVYSIKTKSNTIKIIINPTNSFKKIKINSKFSVIFTTYSNKIYQKPFYGLNPYESIIVLK